MRELRILSYLSLIVGGFLVITYAALFYFAIWHREFIPVFPEAGARFIVSVNSTLARAPPHGRMFETDPISLVLSPQALGILLTGLLLLVNGYYLQKHLRQKENKETRKFVISALLTSEEKALYDELARSGGQATQKQLSLRTGFSAVKTYRILHRLEAKKLVKSFPFGMTKKIILNQETPKM